MALVAALVVLWRVVGIMSLLSAGHARVRSVRSLEDRPGEAFLVQHPLHRRPFDGALHVGA